MDGGKDSAGEPKSPIGSADTSAFYHLCLRCDAKWFGRENSAPCPRCGKACLSDERAVPPWKRTALEDGGAGCDSI